jgi:hypothetical protein
MISTLHVTEHAPRRSASVVRSAAMAVVALLLAAGVAVGQGQPARAADGASPFGSVDSVSVDGQGRMTVAGWTIDPDTASPVEAHLYVDGRGVPSVANLRRDDVGGAFPQYGSNHGFEISIDVEPGRHSVCVFGINVGPGSNTLLQCRDTTSYGSISYSYPTSPFIITPLASGQYGAPRSGYDHQGVDILPKTRGVDQPILSVASGTVIFIGPLSSGWGHYVDVRNDDGVRVRYAHLKARAIVNVGQRVNEGQRLGTMGGSGNGRLDTYAVHLHIEVRPSPSSSATTSPLPFLRARVR